MATLQEIKKQLIGKVIKYGPPGYPMKAKPTSITTKGDYYDVDYELFTSWGAKEWESGHYFLIPKSKMQTLLKKGTVHYKSKDGAHVEITL